MKAMSIIRSFSAFMAYFLLVFGILQNDVTIIIVAGIFILNASIQDLGRKLLLAQHNHKD